MKATSRGWWTRTASLPPVVGLLTALVLAGVAARSGDSSGAWAQGAPNAMAVDADPSTATVDSSAARPLGVDFDVGVNITAAGTPYQGYNLKVQFDSTKLAWVDVAPSGMVYLNSVSHGMTLEGKASLAGDIVNGGAARQADPTSFIGPVALVRFRCVAPGVASLHLVSEADPPANYTSTLTSGGVFFSTGLTDAQITCGEGAAPSPTPTGVAPTPTPVGPRATPTPLPPGLEAVPLVAGCNPVTATYPDGTPIQTIAGAVGPAGSLVSLWSFGAGTWRAFSPQYPQASDLTMANLLDVLFVCVGEPGDFVRPVV